MDQSLLKAGIIWFTTPFSALSIMPGIRLLLYFVDLLAPLPSPNPLFHIAIRKDDFLNLNLMYYLPTSDHFSSTRSPTTALTCLHGMQGPKLTCFLLCTSLQPLLSLPDLTHIPPGSASKPSHRMLFSKLFPFRL